jgi:poly(A) polymerase/tRNA nucleotidyltransferase (CCA-adding enzyme)
MQDTDSMIIPHILNDFARIFHKNNFECYLVGGVVRNLLLKKELTDFDIATNADPKEVQRIFHRVIPTGIKHGTVTVLFKKESFEVTTFRIDGTYTDGRRPDEVRYTSSILQDLERRDFTINGLAYNLISHKLLDPHEGMKDLKKGIIRAIGRPEDRFREDGLRPLRACRFAAQLNFRIEKTTFKAIKKTTREALAVSVERIRDEITKILLSDNPVFGFELLESTGLLVLILPELHACVGVKQRDRHRFDVFYHSLHSCAAAPAENLVLRLAALLHDIGKAATLTQGEYGEPLFHRHEQVSAEMAESFTRRLKYPNAVVKRVSILIRHHMFNYQDEWSDAAIRRFISRAGKENMSDLIDLRLADQSGMDVLSADTTNLAKFIQRLQDISSQDTAFKVRDLKINGKDLMQALNLPSGPQIGILLRFLLEAVLEDPSLNTPDKLTEMAGKFYKERLS